MSVTPIQIIPPKQAEAVNTVQYTVSSGETVIDKFTVTNTSSVSVTFSCNLFSDAVGNKNQIIDSVVIASKETYLCPGLIGQILRNGDKISTIAGAALSLTIMASGREIT